MKRFEAAIGMADTPPDQAPGPPTPEMLETWTRIGGNLEYFLAHGDPADQPLHPRCRVWPR